MHAGDEGEGPGRRPRSSGTAIVIPTGSGKAAGQVVKARFLGGDEPALDEKEPFRPALRRLGDGGRQPLLRPGRRQPDVGALLRPRLRQPLDGFDETNPPSHPELLDSWPRSSPPRASTSSTCALHHDQQGVPAHQPPRAGQRGRHGRLQPHGRQGADAGGPLFVSDLGWAVTQESDGTGSKAETGIPRPVRPLLPLRRGRARHRVHPGHPAVAAADERVRSLNRGARSSTGWSAPRRATPEAITTLYLTVLSRRPTAEEVKLMASYLSRRKDDREGYRGVLWILLNSSEFALNH